ncbi:MAG: hypothetical protein IPJ82_14395 [Lewinellaceae bacterium]|nr:hypothetical protein [Lewinellaceae bacterium]
MERRSKYPLPACDSPAPKKVSVDGLPAGQYQLTATDHNGCTKVSQLYDIQSLV